MKVFAAISATVIFIVVLFMKIVLRAGVGGSVSIMTSLGGVGQIYSLLTRKADKIVDVMIGTAIEICNFTRRKRLGMNVQRSGSDRGVAIMVSKKM